MNCGREPGGQNVEDLGICPAAVAQEYDGVKQGKAGGRLCWVVSGTLLQRRGAGHVCEEAEGLPSLQVLQVG